ncbi:MAG: DUF4976 domain-containing protein [Planctomycetota bacterium]|nr:MAG: DUF4976 domain-containing protein [Planctomycetota bacterium]
MRWAYFAGWIVLCCAAVTGGAEPVARPNILFILTDDQGPHAAGYLGNPELKTPHLDRLASEGAQLRNAFCVTPVCSPSRASLATSRYGSELGILDWINPKSQPEVGLNPNAVTWMELLQESGYATGLMGKWHLGTAERYHPTLQGYTEFMGFLDGGRPTQNALLEIGGHEQQSQGFIVDVVTDGAIEFLKAHHQSGPFALSVHYREPHAAWLPARDEDVAPYRDLDPAIPASEATGLDEVRLKKMIREYYISVASVDRSVGRLMRALDELKLRENTIVIFTSDHGYQTGHHGLFHKGNATWMLKEKPKPRWSDIGAQRRPNMFDQSLRVPAIVRWPGVVTAQRVVDRTVTHLDWYPTLLAMAGVELPDDIPVHGRSLVPLLRGTPPSDWSDEFYSEYSMREGATVDMRCWRTPEWKLVIDFRHRDRDELFDLKADPHETTNLIVSERADAQAARQALESRIIGQLRSIGDPLQAELPITKENGQ